ncbi:hypothetical protein GCM10010254_62190 [Streptomyces chromofuscus]|nr:hypothetical protein GCM10010254_62190 [Streptomyces chromofuscus]
MISLSAGDEWSGMPTMLPNVRRASNIRVTNAPTALSRAVSRGGEPCVAGGPAQETPAGTTHKRAEINGR